MLEGKEVDVKIGDVGEAVLDIDDKGFVVIGINAKIDLIAELQKLAAKTATPIDDQAMAWVAKMLGR